MKKICIILIIITICNSMRKLCSYYIDKYIKSVKLIHIQATSYLTRLDRVYIIYRYIHKGIKPHTYRTSICVYVLLYSRFAQTLKITSIYIFYIICQIGTKKILNVICYAIIIFNNYNVQVYGMNVYCYYWIYNVS